MNAVILSNNIYFVKNILNSLETDMSCKIITTSSEFKKALIDNKVDMIFLDDNIKPSFKKAIMSKYKDCTLAINPQEDFQNGILSKNLILQMRDIINYHQEEIIKSRIINELKYLGFSLKHQGTYYLSDIITEIFNNKNNLNRTLRSYFYPLLAEKYGKTPYNIKSSIHKATEHMYYSCNVERLKKYFNYYDDEKPTVKQIIFAIINKLYTF